VLFMFREVKGDVFTKHSSFLNQGCLCGQTLV
jgi:hypothetical protein